MYQKAVELAEGQRLVPRAPVRDRRPTPTIHENTTAREILADFNGRAARLLRHRLRHRRHADRRRARAAQGAARDRRSSCASRRTRQLLGSGIAQERGADGSPGGQPLRPSSRTRSRAGRRTSSRWCCRRRSTRSTTTSCVPIAGADGDRVGAAARRRRKASSPASRAARRSRSPCRSRPRRAGGLGDPAACCPTPASATCRRRCSRASPRTWTTRSSKSRSRRRATRCLSLESEGPEPRKRTVTPRGCRVRAAARPCGRASAMRIPSPPETCGW